MSNKQFLSIEGLRGLLALTVCFGHFGFGTLFEPYGLSFNLHFAVDLFFVISGLVLAHSNYYSSQPIFGLTFFAKRIARLYPLHLLTLAIMIILNFSDLSPLNVIENIFLVHNLGLPGSDNSLNFPSWSISVELWCTLLLFYMTRWIKSAPILSILLLLSIILITLLNPTLLMYGDYEGTTILNHGLLRGLIGTSLGIVIYHTLNSTLAKPLFNNALIGYLCAIGLSSYFFLDLPLNSGIYFYILSFFLIGTLAYQPNFLRLLSSKSFVWLGAISYSVYLLHIPLYHVIQTLFGTYAVKGLSGKLLLLPTLFLLSSLVFIYIERPLQRLLRKFLMSYPLKGEQYA